MRACVRLCVGVCFKVEFTANIEACFFHARVHAHTHRHTQTRSCPNSIINPLKKIPSSIFLFMAALNKQFFVKRKPSLEVDVKRSAILIINFIPRVERFQGANIVGRSSASACKYILPSKRSFFSLRRTQ